MYKIDKNLINRQIMISISKYIWISSKLTNNVLLMDTSNSTTASSTITIIPHTLHTSHVNFTLMTTAKHYNSFVVNIKQFRNI